MFKNLAINMLFLNFVLEMFNTFALDLVFKNVILNMLANNFILVIIRPSI